MNMSKMNRMVSRLMSDGLMVSRVPDCEDTLHVDGYHGADAKGLPDWIYDMKGWAVSSCGFGRVFMSQMKTL